MSVNLAASQFDQPDLVDQIRAVIAESGIDAGSLRLEITESTLMRNVEATIETLHALRALGVRLAIDDFGTGYWSLSYLRRFPVDTLKIDRSFTMLLDNDPTTAAIVESIIALANALGMDVTAEGIETAAQLAQVRALYCPHGQGFLFSRPVSEDTMGQMLTAGALPRYAA